MPWIEVDGAKCHYTPTSGSTATPEEVAAEIRRVIRSADEAQAKRHADMPDERSAIDALQQAHTRLTELGWRDAIYCPKDGSTFDVIEAGSTGIHTAHYDGVWPKGSWWIHADGDLSPSRPILFRPHGATASAAAAGNEQVAAQVEGEGSREEHHSALPPVGAVAVSAEAQARVEALETMLRTIRETVVNSEEWWMTSPSKGGFNLDKIDALLSGSTPKPALHPATRDLVDRFAAALAEKLAKAEAKYGYTDGWLSANWEADCREALLGHIDKGDPRDVAAYCAFMWHHGWPTVVKGQREECEDCGAQSTELMLGLCGACSVKSEDRAHASATTEKLAQALTDITEPLAYLRRKAEEQGRRLGGDAYTIANSSELLKSIARDALSTLTPSDGAAS